MQNNNKGTIEFKIPKSMERKFDFTPGPWECNKLYSKVSNKDFEICEVSVNEPGDDFNFDQYSANAILISNAPLLPELALAIIAHSEGKLSLEYLKEMAKTALDKLK